MEHALRQAANERSEEKRRIYGQFLVGAIKSPGEPYEEQLRFLRTLEEMQPDHIKVLRALMQKPDSDLDAGFSGSPRQTLARRLPDIPADRIEDLVSQLNDMWITNLTAMRTMMTARGAQNLEHTITPFGQRFLKFLTGEA